MESIIKYKAKDGKEFTSESGCLEYEKLIDHVDLIMSELNPIPKDDGCHFSNGGGFIQQDIKTFKKVRIEILKEIGKNIDHPWVKQALDNPEAHPSWIDRLVGDYGIAPLNSAWYRIGCTDLLGREWGQPYFRNNPHEAKQIQLNKK